MKFQYLWPPPEKYFWLPLEKSTIGSPWKKLLLMPMLGIESVRVLKQALPMALIFRVQERLT